jgi:S1-C subfamily serine protease
VVVVIALIVIAGALGSLYLYNSIETGNQISSLQKTVSTLQSQQQSLFELESGNGTYPGTNFFTPASSQGSSNATLNPVSIYEYANSSVVTVQGIQTATDAFGQSSSTPVLGSGFVVTYSNTDYIVTNYHVVQSDSNLSVTFSNGDGYAARVVGSDPYSDLAVLSVEAPSFEFHPLAVVTSSSLVVGENVLAIGNPFGLSGSETTGIISQLGRTIQDTTAGNYQVANVIQISTPINPGNSGGPLFNSFGQVIGITTAIVSGSQGVGFAIPSDTILQELPYLITTGSYSFHPYLGISTADMSYDLSRALGVNVTYGILVESVVNGGPAAKAGIVAGTQTITVDGEQLTSGGDIIVSINGTRVVNGETLSSWLQEHALPKQVVDLGVIRNGALTTVQVTLGTRPPISS